VLRRTVRLAVLALAAGLAVAPAPAASATTPDANYPLPSTGFSDMAVDAAHDHLFISGNGSAILVRTLNGAAVTTIAANAGARGLTLSADGSTLYAALSAQDAIAAFDTTTLAEKARYATGSQTCPEDVAVIGTSLWFGYGCGGASWNHRLGVVDLSGEAPAVTLAKTAVTFYAGIWVVAAGDYLLVTGKGSSPTTLYSYPVTGTTLGTPATVSISSPGDVAVTPDNTRVIVPPGASYSQPMYNVADLSNAGSYSNNHPYPNSALAANGYLVSGEMAWYDPDIRVFRASDGAAIRTYELGGSYYSLIGHGLASTPDLSILYAVSSYHDGTGNNTHTLHVRHDPTKIPTTITMARPSTATVNTSYTLTGTLSAGAGQVVHVKRTSSYGTVTLADRTTGSGGSFTITDKVTKRGVYTYTATFDGNATYGGTSKALGVKVLGLTPSMTISTNASNYRYGATAYVTGHLGTTQSRTLKLTAKPYGSTATTLKTGTVNGSGNLSSSRVVSRRTTFYAIFAGDAVYEPRTVYRTVTVGARIAQSLTGYYGTSGSYRLYRQSTDPQINVVVSPNNAGACQSFTAQAYQSGAWSTFSTASCMQLDYGSSVAAYLVGNHPTGISFRVRSTFNGSTLNSKTVGGWLYLRYTT